MGEARLWYETLNVQQQQLDWAGLQEKFRQQYSKFGNTREQYFHAWRSFQFDEATNTIDGYIQNVKEVAALLDYGEPQFLELFKNTLPSRPYYMLFQIDNLRIAVETAKRLLTESSRSRSSSRSKNRYENRRQSRDDTRNRDRSESRSRSSSHISTNWDRIRCYRCNEYDHFARECPNDTTGRNSDDAKGYLLRMLDTDQTYAFNYADGEDYSMDLNM